MGIHYGRLGASRIFFAAAALLLVGMAAAQVVTPSGVVFANPVPADRLAGLTRFDGAAAGGALRDKQFRKTLEGALPDCLFHYGRDLPLVDVLELALDNSTAPVVIHDSRYMMVSSSGPRAGFAWIDLRAGVVLGGFYFHPTNGEPTPTLTVFSRQVKQDEVNLSDLPAPFLADLDRWSRRYGLPAALPRYFITGANQKVLLQDDVDHCLTPDGGPGPDDCAQINADAANNDLNTAYYLEQTHHATNATARMIEGAELTLWTQQRDAACRGDRDRIGCSLRLTRQQIGRVAHRPRAPAPVRGHSRM